MESSSAIEQAFFSMRNRNMIITMIERDIHTIKKKALTSKQRERIAAIADHYMGEVYKVQGNKPLAFLNKETIAISEKQFQRSKHFPATRTITASSVVAVSAPAPVPLPIQTQFPIQDETPLSMNELFEMAKAKREAGTSLNALQGVDADGDDLVNSLGLLTPIRQPNASPNIAIPPIIVEKPTLQQQVLIKDDNVKSYKETESNLILYSIDRDWGTDYGENRYNFSVTFDPTITRQGAGRSLESIRRFNNIVRIELVKAIIPLESIDTLVYRGGEGTDMTNLETNVFSLPQIVVRIDEFTANNYGTDDVFDNAFGILQYDGTWKTDTNGQTKGYVAMVPKFMKCQRIFYPTPLSTLQKLTIRLERPDGSLIDNHPDAFKMNSIITSTALGDSGSASIYTDSDNSYLVIRTEKFFSHFRMQRGDRIQLKDIVMNISPIGTPEQIAAIAAAGNELNQYLSRAEGHLICDVAYESGATAAVDGWNGSGYSNLIIIRNRFANPDTGLDERNYFGGSLAAENVLFESIEVHGPLVNVSRQTQLVFRIITRDMDSTLQIRPDNSRP